MGGDLGLVRGHQDQVRGQLRVVVPDPFVCRNGLAGAIEVSSDGGCPAVKEDK